jgi:branched-chain amino acid transport system ATP-binding protein
MRPAVGRDDDPVLELESVTAGYGPYRALDRVTLSVGRGEAIALVGANGAGKSTVARVCAGLVKPSNGRVIVAGSDLNGAPPWAFARAGVASVPEGRGVFATLTVEENLVLGLTQWLGRGAVSRALQSAYDRFPILAERRSQLAGSLSGGQQRLLSLAKVLGVSPLILVADELSLGLSPAAIDDIYEQLRSLHEAGTAMLLIEQRVDRVLALTSAAAVLDRGRVVFSGPGEQAAGVLEELLGAAATSAQSTCADT